MDFKLETQPLTKVKADTLVVGVFQDEDIGKLLSKLDKTVAADFVKRLSAYAADEGFRGKKGQWVAHPGEGALASRKVILSGLGKESEHTHSGTRKMAANLARRMRSGSKRSSLCLYLRAGGDGKKHAQAAVEGWILGSYMFSKYKTSKDDKPALSVEKIAIGGAGLSSREFTACATTGEAIAAATNFARDLIAEPPAHMTPTRFAQEARRVARENGLTCTVMGADQVERLGMGAFLGVARGAKEPLKFVVIKYAPEKAKPKRKLALVGKGITFDSGGLSLKNAQSMEHMKYDMSGAAAVLATMQAVGRLKPPVAVTGIAALTENMPGGAALHPGDVLVAMNGKTIEVNNTDAEGRLILADALCYAGRQKPDETIDIATLTGAVVTALGRVAAGIMGTDQKLIDRLMAAGEDAGELLWQLPLFEEYKEGLKSDIADLKNSGSRGEAGSSSAGMFLKEFVDGRPWAHLDIAGGGWSDRERDEVNKGGTAFGVRTLCRYILSI